MCKLLQVISMKPFSEQKVGEFIRIHKKWGDTIVGSLESEYQNISYMSW